MKLCEGACWLSVCAAGAIGASLLLGGAGATQPEKKPEGKAPAAPAGQPNMDEMMKMFQAMAAPGPEHAILKAFDGQWNGKVETFGQMAAPPSDGVMKNSWVLGGRFLRQEWKGEFMKQPFEGLGYWGFDRAKKKWIGTWMDTMGTGAMVMEGDYDAGKKVWTMTGGMTNPMGVEERFRQTITVKDADTHVLDMYGAEAPGAKEELMMKITYTRKK